MLILVRIWGKIKSEFTQAELDIIMASVYESKQWTDFDEYWIHLDNELLGELLIGKLKELNR